MSDPISTFFNAWQYEDVDTRRDLISQSVAQDVHYDDPRTQETIKGVDALFEYVGMFSANAPGWSAKVLSTDTIGGVTRATIAFSGMGPDGEEKIQHGQYFIEKNDDLISRMVGFVGIGKLE